MKALRDGHRHSSTRCSWQIVIVQSKPECLNAPAAWGAFTIYNENLVADWWACMQELMERAVVLTQGGGQPQASPALGDLVAQYSTILASQVSVRPFVTHVP